MAVVAVADGFLGRWAKRKAAVREGKVVAEVVAPKEAPPPQPSPGGGGSKAGRPSSPQPSAASGRGSKTTPDIAGAGVAASDELLPPPLGVGGGGGTARHEASGSANAEPPPDPTPTLEDTHSLTADSDFARYTRPDVSPAVRNAAMKKLFSDPHFNVMDRLDTYIDDYSLPDPIPPDMLRKLMSAPVLNLFAAKEEDSAPKDPEARDVADAPAPDSVAQSGTAGPGGQAVPPAADAHADPDLRLQQDHAAGPEGPGHGDR